MDTETAQRYERGQQNIDHACRQELDRRGVRGAATGYRQPLRGPSDATFLVSVGEQTVEQHFSFEDIVQSCERLTADALAKVRKIAARASYSDGSLQSRTQQPG